MKYRPCNHPCKFWGDRQRGEGVVRGHTTVRLCDTQQPAQVEQSLSPPLPVTLSRDTFEFYRQTPEVEKLLPGMNSHYIFLPDGTTNKSVELT